MYKLIITMVLFIYSVTIFADTVTDNDTPLTNNKVTLLTKVTVTGQKIHAIALEYEDNVLSGSNLTPLYQVTSQLKGGSEKYRRILRAYVNDKPEVSFHPQAGKFIILELDVTDENANLYSIEKENTQQMSFYTKDKKGNIITTEKVQANSVPIFYGKNLSYHISQKGFLKLTNGKTIDRFTVQVDAREKNVSNGVIDKFLSARVESNPVNNFLDYRIYKPELQTGKKYPLTIFLHGSGQVGSDNLAQLLSSKGAIVTLNYTPAFVLAPQYRSVFDPFDNIRQGQPGGIHWQTANRRHLVLRMIDKTLAENPQIDRQRIYLIGLSRGAEGAMWLLQDRPDFFAAALLMSGREAGTVEWIDGNASIKNLAPLKNTPIWFFHSAEDKISPVSGSRINYQILKEKLHSSKVRYTEFNFTQSGDNGIINNNAHNTWDAVFNSPEVMNWLLINKLVNIK